MKKYELTTEYKEIGNIKLFRVKALTSFGNVQAGELGGYIEKEDNLSQDGNAKVRGNARVDGNAWVRGNALVSDNAQVYSNALVSGNAWVDGNARIDGNARVSGNAWVDGNAEVSGNAWVRGNAQVYSNAKVRGNARVDGNAKVRGNARVDGNAKVDGDAEVSGNAKVRGNEDYTTIKGFGRECRSTTFFRQKDGSIGVVCGCFYGTLDEFRKKVRETHGESKYAKEYLMIADLMEMHFDRSEGE